MSDVLPVFRAGRVCIILTEDTGNNRVPIHYTDPGPNVVPVQTVMVAVAGVVPCVEVEAGPNVVLVAETE